MRLMLHAYVSYLSAALPINEKINKSACAAAGSFVVEYHTRQYALSNYCDQTIQNSRV